MPDQLSEQFFENEVSAESLEVNDIPVTEFEPDEDDTDKNWDIDWDGD